MKNKKIMLFSTVLLLAIAITMNSTNTQKNQEINELILDGTMYTATKNAVLNSPATATYQTSYGKITVETKAKNLLIENIW